MTKSLAAFVEDENYLWYREVPDLDGALFSTAVGYYDALEDPVYVPSGKKEGPVLMVAIDRRI